MGSLWFLKLALKCIDLLAWPLLALGYPLCASVQAIETDSHSDTRNLISYWILLSLIYLIEYAFVKLLEWLRIWTYIKLIIILWLIIPDFGRASYVYNHLVHSCISMNPQAVISGFNNLKSIFVKKENFLLQAEKYIEENGTEVLAKLIASKNTIHNVDAEAEKAIPGTEKKELPQTNGRRLPIEQKEIKDLEVIEKKEVFAGMQVIPADPNFALNESTASAKAETKQMTGKNVADEVPQCSASKNVQKEWTCAICQVTTQSETTLNSHLHGRKHKATCEALKAKNQPNSMSFGQASMVKKSDLSTEETKKIESASALKQKNIINQHAKIEQKHMQIPNAKEYSESYWGPEVYSAWDSEEYSSWGPEVYSAWEPEVYSSWGEPVENLGINVGMNHSGLRCEICNVSCTSEGDMASHLNGKKHLRRSTIEYVPSVEYVHATGWE